MLTRTSRSEVFNRLFAVTVISGINVGSYRLLSIPQHTKVSDLYIALAKIFDYKISFSDGFVDMMYPVTLKHGNGLEKVNRTIRLDENGGTKHRAKLMRDLEHPVYDGYVLQVTLFSDGFVDGVGLDESCLIMQYCGPTHEGKPGEITCRLALGDHRELRATEEQAEATKGCLEALVQPPSRVLGVLTHEGGSLGFEHGWKSRLNL